MNKNEVLEIMSIEEIKDKLKNPIQYKLNALIENYNTQLKDIPLDLAIDRELHTEITHKRNRILNFINTINDEFYEEFPDEPTDDDLKVFKR